MANQKYQYETSPRKIEPQYKEAKPKVKKQTTAPKKKKVSKTSKETLTHKMERKKLILSLILIFSAIFAISYRNSKIDESFAKNEEIKQKYLLIQKENDQINVDIENSLNLSNIEQAAKEQLGMQNLSNKQTVYINLPKKDYVQPATESVVMQEKQSFLERLLEKIKNIF